MVFILGLLIGLVAGCVQFMLLARFSRGILGGSISAKSIMYGVVQFLIPFAVLICCALVIPDDLIWAGCGIVAALFAGAIINAVLSRNKRGGEKE